MVTIDQMLAVVLMAGLFIGLITYRTWTERREQRKRQHGDTSGSRPPHTDQVPR